MVARKERAGGGTDVDFQLSEEQQMLREATRRLLETSAPLPVVRALADSSRGHDPDAWRKGAELGWPALALPEDAGGSGGDLVDLTIVAEEHGRMVSPGPLVSTSVVAAAVARHATAALRDEVLPTLVDGTSTGSWAFAEPGAPWSTSGLRCIAEKTADGYRLSGVKTVVQSAGSARWLLVTALLDGAPAGFVIDTTSTPVATRPLRTLDITRRFDEVRLDDVSVDASSLLGGPDEAATQRLLDEAAVLTCADAVGVGARLLDMTVDYAKVRVQFGRPIGSFQAIKHKCADMRLWLQGSRVATYHAAMSLAADTPDASVAATVAKSFTSEAISRLAGEALQIHGGIGMTWEHDLHLFLRRAKTDEVLFGDPALHRARLCDHLVEMHEAMHGS
jgi:alkylation response protein AidB-like acyl-CoA dehydrogenase